VRRGPQRRCPAPTLQVQVLGAGGGLRGDLGVDLDSVQVVGVPGDDDVVPVVVVQRLVGVALDEVGPVSQVRHVVQVPGQVSGMQDDGRQRERERERETL